MAPGAKDVQTLVAAYPGVVGLTALSRQIQKFGELVFLVYLCDKTLCHMLLFYGSVVCATLNSKCKKLRSKVCGSKFATICIVGEGDLGGGVHTWDGIDRLSLGPTVLEA